MWAGLRFAYRVYFLATMPGVWALVLGCASRRTLQA
jgi:hypothetical protein